MSHRPEKLETPIAGIESTLRQLDKDPLNPSRRTFLETSGAFALSAYLTQSTLIEALTGWTSETYESNGTTLRVDGGSNLQSNMLIVSFGGEGNFSDYWGGKANFAASGGRIPCGDMIYDDAGRLNFDDMATVLVKSQQRRKYEYLVIDGDSSGTMYGMVAAAHAGIPVGGFISNCGLISIADARESAKITAAIVSSEYNPKGKLAGMIEVGMKDVYCYIRDNGARERRQGGLGELAYGVLGDVLTLPEQISHGASSRLQESEVVNDETLDIPRYARELRNRGLISKNFTTAVYLRASHDTVVNDWKAYDRLATLFLDTYGIDMNMLHMRRGSQHADVFAAAACLRQYGYFDDLIARLETNTDNTLT